MFERLARGEWRSYDGWLCWRKCGFVGGSVSLWGGTVGSPMLSSAQHRITASSLLPTDQDVKLSTPPAPCLPTRCQASHQYDNGLNL